MKRSTFETGVTYTLIKGLNVQNYNLTVEISNVITYKDSIPFKPTQLTTRPAQIIRNQCIYDIHSHSQHMTIERNNLIV